MTKKLLIVAAMAVALVGCSQGEYGRTHGIRDAPVGNQDDTAAFIINFPDQFENVAFKCHGVDGIYTTTRQAPPVVIVNDPACH